MIENFISLFVDYLYILDEILFILKVSSTQQYGIKASINPALVLYVRSYDSD